MLINHQNILKTIQLSRFKNSNSINFDYSNLFATFGYRYKHKVPVWGKTWELYNKEVGLGI
jgi:hypothetical protein